MSELKKTNEKTKESPVVQQKEMEEKTKESLSVQQITTVVYIGPDISGVKQYTIYNNGLPDVLKERIKEHPFFNALVVPVEKLAQANKELAKEGSALSVLYRKASEKQKEKER